MALGETQAHAAFEEHQAETISFEDSISQRAHEIWLTAPTVIALLPFGLGINIPHSRLPMFHFKAKFVIHSGNGPFFVGKGRLECLARRIVDWLVPK